MKLWLRLAFGLAAWLLVMLACSSRVWGREEAREASTLTTIHSMAQDPDAFACFRQACRQASQTKPVTGTGSSEFDVHLNRCVAAHRERLMNTLYRKAGSELRAYDLGEHTPSVQEFVCTDASGRVQDTDIAKEADRAQLAQLEDQRQRLIAEMKVAPAPPKPVPVPIVTAASAAAAVPSSHAAMPSVPETPASCLPVHTRLVSANSDEAVLFIEPGADFGQLATSCLSSFYETSPRTIIANNPVEATIPYCRKAGTLEFDPWRVSEVLSGKRRLELGGRPHLGFLTDCANRNGIVGLALQARQHLLLKATADLSLPPTNRVDTQAPTPPSDAIDDSPTDSECPDPATDDSQPADDYYPEENDDQLGRLDVPSEDGSRLTLFLTGQLPRSPTVPREPADFQQHYRPPGIVTLAHGTRPGLLHIQLLT